MRKLMTLASTAMLLATLDQPALAKEDPLANRLTLAREVYLELIGVPDREVPEGLLAKCKCIGVFPDVYKGAIGFGARFGRGVVSCRDARGWSPPTFFTMSGGSFGFQFGGESADVVLFFMTDRSARSLLESKFTLGGKASVAAGPLGRSAEAATDLKLDAEIYSYATAKGLFAGVSLEGAMVATDAKSNTTFYGQAIEPKVVLFEHKTPKLPDVARTFIDALPVAGKVAAE